MFESKKIFEAKECGLRSSRYRQHLLWSDATLETKRWCAQQAARNVVIQMAAHVAISGSENASLLFQNPPFTKSVYSGKYTTDVTEPVSLSRSPNNFSDAKSKWLKNLMKLYGLNPSWSKTRQIQALSLMDWADSFEEHENTIQAGTESIAISQDDTSTPLTSGKESIKTVTKVCMTTQDDAATKDSHIPLTSEKGSTKTVTKVDMTTVDDASAKESYNPLTSEKERIKTVTKVGMTTQDEARVNDSASVTLGKSRVGKVIEGKTPHDTQQTLPLDEPQMTDMCKKRKCESASDEAKKRPRSISNKGDMGITEIVVFGAEDCCITKEERAWVNNEERQQRLIEARRREAVVKKEVEKARHWEAETRKRKHGTCHEPEAETKKRMLEPSHKRQPESKRIPEIFHQRQSETYRRPETFYHRRSESYSSGMTFHQRESESRREHGTFYHPAMHYRRHRV